MDNAHDLTLRLHELLRRERFALAEFLLALADFDRARRWLDLGYTSLFYFLHRELGLSKGAAHYRATAAALVQRFPDLVEPLRDGRICLTTVVELAKVLTLENRDEVLPRFFHLSKAEAKEIAVEIRPEAAPRRDLVAAVRSPDPAPSLPLPTPPRAVLGQLVHPANQLRSEAVPGPPAPLPPSAPPAPRPLPDAMEPLTAELSRLHVTVPRRVARKLEAARDALSHSQPGAGLAEILEAGLDLLLERHARRKGLVKRPRKEPRPSKDPDYVPAHVRRAVWIRDGGRCQWPMASGGICGSTRQVEIDHRLAKALGGRATVEGLRCLCKPHNLEAARQAFGDAWMDRFARNPRRVPHAPERGSGRGGRPGGPWGAPPE